MAGRGGRIALPCEQLKADGTLIRAIDLYSLSPIDKAGLVAAGRATCGHLITVEDHYPAGGVADAVDVADAGFAVHRLAVRAMPPGGKPEELLGRYGISAGHIVTAVHSVNAGVSRRSPVTSR